LVVFFFTTFLIVFFVAAHVHLQAHGFFFAATVFLTTAFLTTFFAVGFFDTGMMISLFNYKIQSKCIDKVSSFYSVSKYFFVDKNTSLFKKKYFF